MDCLFAAQQPSVSGVIGEASIPATLIALLTAVAVRFGPAHLKEKLIFFALYVPLCTGIGFSVFFNMAPRLHEQAATIIYLCAAFGFAIHNFHIATRAHFVNGMVWGFLIGLLITFLGSHWAFRLGDPVIHNNFAFLTAHIVFVLGWGFVCLSIFLRQRKAYSVNVAESSPP